MEVSLVSILKQLKKIELKFSVLYKNISTMKSNYSQPLSNVTAVLAFEEKKHAEKYQELINTYKDEEQLMVDEEIYRQIKQAFVEFNNSIVKKKDSNIQDILEMAVEYEKINAEIINEVISLLEKDKEHDQIKALELFRFLLDEEVKHSNNIKVFIK